MNPKVLILISVVLSGLAQVCLKKGLIEVQKRERGKILSLLWSVAGEPFVWIWGLTFVAATALWLVGLQRVDLSYAYPLVSLGYVLVAILAMVVFHEKIDRGRWTAIAVIGLGVVLIAGS
jgi:drug/metabolite transporter (DMT)-like permease